MFTEEIKEMLAKVREDLSHSSTAAPSALFAGPFNVVVGAISTSLKLGLHFPGYDAPRDP